MTIEELYTTLNADFEDACRRLINKDIVCLFVKKFPTDPSMQNFRDAVAAGDIETSFRSVHTLKGLAGNLGFTKLYQAAWNLTEQLRPRLDQANPEMAQALEEEYARTMAALHEYMGD